MIAFLNRSLCALSILCLCQPNQMQPGTCNTQIIALSNLKLCEESQCSVRTQNRGRIQNKPIQVNLCLLSGHPWHDLRCSIDGVKQLRRVSGFLRCTAPAPPACAIPCPGAQSLAQAPGKPCAGQIHCGWCLNRCLPCTQSLAQLHAFLLCCRTLGPCLQETPHMLPVLVFASIQHH